MSVLVVYSGANQDGMRGYVKQRGWMSRILRTMVRRGEYVGFEGAIEEFVNRLPPLIFRVAGD